jgi:hypothetical protein
MSDHKQIKSKKRVADHGEVFTAAREVNAMLDLVKEETERIDSRFLEPACGDGNFLAEILIRKLNTVKKRYSNNPQEYEKYAVLAVTSIYGVDILSDNIELCIKRLFNIVDKEYSKYCNDIATENCRQSILYILRHNILCGDTLTMTTTEGDPIIFSEWSLITGGLLKRRDFRFDQLIKVYTPKRNLFTQNEQGWVYDDEAKAYIPVPIREFPPIHYTMVQNND